MFFVLSKTLISPPNLSINTSNLALSLSVSDEICRFIFSILSIFRPLKSKSASSESVVRKLVKNIVLSNFVGKSSFYFEDGVSQFNRNFIDNVLEYCKIINSFSNKKFAFKFVSMHKNFYANF